MQFGISPWHPRGTPDLLTVITGRVDATEADEGGGGPGEIPS